MTDDLQRLFFDAAKSWLCDGYALDIRYLADTFSGHAKIWEASIELHPLKAAADNQFCIQAEGLMVGQVQMYPMKRAVLFKILDDASKGHLAIAGCALEVDGGQSLQYYSEMSHRDRWFSQLHLRVDGSRRPLPSSAQLARIDSMLRRGHPPFDGLADVGGWLGLRPPGTSESFPSITVRVGPPADLLVERCSLIDDTLLLTVHAHPRLDVNQIGLAIRAVPGRGLASRIQAAYSIKWKRVREGRREGLARICLESADQALAVLSIGDSMVRRQWFIDPTKARNNRLLAIQHFDKDLKMVRQAVLESHESWRFESGVAALLFLHGFTPAVQLETDAPDLVVATPLGRLAIVECTTRVADFAAKLGKLIDRRGALTKALSASGHPAQIIAVLVCRQPMDQIATQIDDLRRHGVILLAGEQLSAGFDRVRFPSDPDHLLDTSFAQLSNQSS